MPTNCGVEREAYSALFIWKSPPARQRIVKGHVSPWTSASLTPRFSNDDSCSPSHTAVALTFVLVF